MIIEQFFMPAFSLRSNDQLTQLFLQSHILFLFGRSHLLPLNVVFFCNFENMPYTGSSLSAKWHQHPFIVFRSTESIYERGNQGIIWKFKNMSQHVQSQWDEYRSTGFSNETDKGFGSISLTLSQCEYIPAVSIAHILNSHYHTKSDFDTTLFLYSSNV